MTSDADALKAANVASTATASILEPLTPLVMAGYKSLASRAAAGLSAWYSSLGQERSQLIDSKLVLLKLPGSTPAPMLYVATGGVVQQRVLSSSGSLLEDTVSGAMSELSGLAKGGDVAGVNPAIFERLFSALDYGIFKQQPTTDEAFKIAVSIAVSSYSASERGEEFVRQLDALAKLGGVKFSEHLQGVDYTEEGQLALMIFKLSPKEFSVLNIINSLRLLYAAANAVAPQQKNLHGLGERLVAAAATLGIPDGISEEHLADSYLQNVAEALGNVSRHKGVEVIILECKEPLPYLKSVLRLTNVLDTVLTGKRALTDNDKPYSDAVGLAELVR